MRFKKIMQLAIVCLLFLNGSVFGDEILEEAPEVFTEEHVSVGSGQKDSSKRDEIKNRRAEELSETPIDDTLETQKILQKVSNHLQGSTSPCMLASCQRPRPQLCHEPVAYSVNCHCLVDIADNGRTIEIEDGSHWEIAPNDVHILRSWRRNHSLIITPNPSWFNAHDYYITNTSKNLYVKANLKIGPKEHGVYSHWIVNIDYYGGHVYLENQMVWCVDPQDSYILKDWKIDHHVILGNYSSWFSSYDHILINVNMDDNVRVKQY